MPEKYGELIRVAREQHSPPMTAKQLAEKLKVKAPFITDIEKGRRLPSLSNQKKIKKLLACEQFPDYLFDDLASFAIGVKLGMRLAVESMISLEDITEPKFN